jgi:threonyl-tRNA synthetase
VWNVKTKVIPATIRATGTIWESIREYLNNILEKHDMKELQKTAILSTAHIDREGIMQKYKTFIMENNISFTFNCN